VKMLETVYCFERWKVN